MALGVKPVPGVKPSSVPGSSYQSLREGPESLRSYGSSACVTGPCNGDEVLCFNGATAAQVRRARECASGGFPCEGASGHRASHDGASTADWLLRGGAASRSCERSFEVLPATEPGAEAAAEPQRRRGASLSIMARLSRGVRSVSEGRHRDSAALLHTTQLACPPSAQLTLVLLPSGEFHAGITSAEPPPTGSFFSGN
jgi:hypothetical protein